MMGARRRTGGRHSPDPRGLLRGGTMVVRRSAASAAAPPRATANPSGRTTTTPTSSSTDPPAGCSVTPSSSRSRACSGTASPTKSSTATSTKRSRRCPTTGSARRACTCPSSGPRFATWRSGRRARSSSRRPMAAGRVTGCSSSSAPLGRSTGSFPIHDFSPTRIRLVFAPDPPDAPAAGAWHPRRASHLADQGR